MISDHLEVNVTMMTTNSKRTVGGMSTEFSKLSMDGIKEVEDKLKESQLDELVKFHRDKNCDQQCTTKLNRQFITLFHNSMFPTDSVDSSPTPDISRLQVLIDSSIEVRVSWT